MMFRIALVLCCLSFSISSILPAQEPVFSGPQVSETLPSFSIRKVLGEDAGQDVDPIADADGQPVLLLFVHEVTRPSIALVRTVCNYAVRRQPDGLQTTVVFLTSDPNETEAFAKRASHAIPDPKQVQLGMSMDGLEGPGAYGLNRKVTITALIATKNKVTENLALIQPNVATDAVKLGAAIAKVLGDEKAPTLSDMDPQATRMLRMPERGGANGSPGVDDATFRAKLAPLIRKNASEDDVRKAADAIEAFAAENKAFQERVAETANRIIDAGKLEDYGTPAAQVFLQKWAKEWTDDAQERGADAPSAKNSDES